MKSLLPILKTKLFILSFISACTVLLATTVPQIRNFIASEKAIGEKITTGQKKISPKINKQNQTVRSSRVTSSVPLEMNNPFVATVVSDKPDYAPLSTATFTGDGFNANEEVVLKVKNLNQPCNTVAADSSYIPWTVTADDNGHFVTTWTVCDCPGDSLRLKATGQLSGLVAYTYFTDAPNDYTISVSPTTLCPNNTVTLRFTIVITGSNEGCFQLTIPSGYTSASAAFVSATGGKNWTPSIAGSTINVSANSNGDRLSDPSTLIFDVQVTAPASGTGTWTTVLKGNITCGGSSTAPLSPGSPTTTVQDNTPPTITCPSNVTVQCSSDVPPVNIASVTATDACSTPTVTHVGDVTSGQTCANRYTITRTYKATDASGETSACAQTITVNDQTAPVISIIPADVTVSCAGSVPSANDGGVTASDNCGGVVTISHNADVITPGSCANRYSIARTYIATDVCGNSSSQTQTITVNDQTAPVISIIPADVTVSCAGSVPSANDAGVTASDNCGGVVTISHNADVITPGSCANRYSIARTYKATDVCGNSSSQTQTITVNDQTAPVISIIPADVTVSCAGSVPSANDGGVTASDNCGGVVTISHNADVITPGSCANRYSIARTYKATDVCGNSSSQTQTITVNDQTAPVISIIPADVTVSCAGSVPSANDAGVTASDNCGGVVTISHNADVITPGSCANRYSIARTYKATDVCGNSSSQTQTITVNDQTAPVISIIPADVTVSCAGSVPSANDAGVTASDNCGGVVTISHNADVITPGSCANRYSIARTYKATDVCGNSSSQTQTITVNDQTAPVISTIPADVTVSCAGSVPSANDGGVTASDNCGGVVTISHNADVITPGSCANRYSIARTYKATDVCGNSSSQTQTITVNDQTAPVISTIPADVTVSCAGSVPSANDAGVTASDNCGGVVTISHNADVITPGSCANRYSIARTYIATDVCGNSSSQTQTITVNDQTAPVISIIPADVTVSCAGSVPSANDGGVTASDNCGGVVTISHNADVITPGSCANRYSIARTYIATDVCGNSSSQTQTITVNDQTAPVISIIPADVTVSCAGSVPSANDAGVTASDNCGGVVTISHNADVITPGSCANRYSIARTYKATDVCGNSSSQTQTITVNDQTAPVISIIPADVTVSCAGSVPSANDGGVTASDNCGGVVTISHNADVITPGSCANRYSIARTYKATDVCGNSSSQTQTITVNDQTAPVISIIPADVTVSCAGSVPSANDAGVTASDNCGGVVTISHNADVITPGSCANRYSIARTYKATDVCGNSSSQTQTITVNDQTAPVISTIPADVTVSCAGSVPSANDAGVTASDNCGGVVTISHNADVITPGSCANRYSIARTYIATDVCGNSSSQTQTITVNDQTAPVISIIPADVTVSCAGSVPSVNDGGVTASDNCGGVVTISHNADVITPGSCANRYSIARTYIATDVCGNSSSQTQTITVNDQTAPVISTIPADVTVSCAGSVPSANDAGVTASDNCGGVVTISHNADVITPGSCANRYSIARTYKATDVCGNSSSQTQTITVNDQTAPVISTIPADVTVSCAGSVPSANDGGVTASDNCGGVVTISHNADVITPGSCANRYSIARTYKATDVCGNSSSQTQTITVNDQTAPVISGVGGPQTIYCPATPSFSSPTASDACGGQTLTYSDASTPGTCANNYSMKRTWKAIDDCGNTKTACQIITVVDNAAPQITATGTTLAVTCNPSASDINAALGTATATDVCGAASVTATDVGPTTATNGCTVTKTRKFTATDACGNTATTSRTVTWTSDVTPPTITGPLLNTTCLWPPNHKMVTVELVATSSDNCGLAPTSTDDIEITSNEPANAIGDGNTEVDWEIVDNNTIRLRAERSGVQSLSIPESGPDYGRIYTVKYKVTDACGNTSTASGTVIVAHNITNPKVGTSYKVNTTVSLNGTFWDRPGKTHTAKWQIDGSNVNGTVVSEPNGNKMGKVSGSYKPTSAGIYKLKMNITDNTGVTSYATTNGDYEAFLVAYDPNGGYTYGGGKFVSPENAAISNPGMTGEVAFGFASNYFKNATNPKGETELVFKDNGVEFSALNYDYLVVTGNKATYKGQGKTIIDGVEQSGYAFLMSVIDGKTPTNLTGTDKIRIKVYNKNTLAIIYDNQPGAPDDADPVTEIVEPLPDGSDIVVVNTSPAPAPNITRSGQMETSGGLAEFKVMAFPNPTGDQFTLYLENGTNEKVSIVVYDMLGREVKKIEKENGNIPIHFGLNFKVGMYVVEVRQGDNRKTLKLVKQ